MLQTSLILELCSANTELTHWQQCFDGAEAASAGCVISLHLQNVGNFVGAEATGRAVLGCFPLTSLCSLCCLIDSSSLRLSSLRAFVSSASSSAIRTPRAAECSRLWLSSLLVRSRISWSSDTLLPSSWASMEPLGSLWQLDTWLLMYARVYFIRCMTQIKKKRLWVLIRALPCWCFCVVPQLKVHLIPAP